jgi:hypothetical protein
MNLTEKSMNLTHRVMNLTGKSMNLIHRTMNLTEKSMNQLKLSINPSELFLYPFKCPHVLFSFKSHEVHSGRNVIY